MTLYEWAHKWGVPLQAIHDLEHAIGSRPDVYAASDSTSEGGVVSRLRLEAAKVGAILWRNNVGAARDERGNFFRYGLCNDTAAVNKVFKSSDLIGIRPVKVTSDMIGARIGQFIARETKRGGWQFSGTDRERAQLKFIELVLSLGGDASFATGEGTL
jgi:hypothetical protein